MKAWSGFSPWYALGIVAFFLLYEMARVNYEMIRDQSVRLTVEANVPIPTGPPRVMRDRDFDREFGAFLSSGYDVIKPGPEDVFKYERRGFERIFAEHRGQSCQVVIGGTADKPHNVPMQRIKITDSAKKLLRTAYTRSVRPDIGYCFICDTGSDRPTIRLDDGSELLGYQAIEVLKELNSNGLNASHPTERNLHCLTKLGEGWALDMIERRLV